MSVFTRSSDSCYGCGDPSTWTSVMYVCDNCKQKPYDPSRPHAKKAKAVA